MIFKLEPLKSDPFNISGDDWDKCLDLADDYGWQRAARSAVYGVNQEEPDHFRYAHNQRVKEGDVRDLSQALEKAKEANVEGAPAILPDLLAFLQECVKTGSDIMLTVAAE